MKNICIIISTLYLLSCTPRVDIKNQPDVPVNMDIQKITIEFPSQDNLLITADSYSKNGNSEFMLLCHQAGFSRGEYINTAPILVDKGFNILTIDQRSGNEVNNVVNQTNLLAKKNGKETDYLSAKQDILAAIDKAYEMNNNKPIYLVGSSYSAALVLLIAKNNDKIKAVASFSPGEYLKGVEVTPELEGYKKNVFVTSSKKETGAVESLVSKIDSKFLSHFKSQVKGIHGSRALWHSTEGHKAYWAAFLEFLSK